MDQVRQLILIFVSGFFILITFYYYSPFTWKTKSPLLSSEPPKEDNSETEFQKLKTILRNYPWNEEPVGDQDCGCTERPKLLGYYNNHQYQNYNSS